MLVEVGTSSIEDVFVVEKSGADQIELCSVREVIGVTPSMGMFNYAKTNVNLPIMIMIRPRPGGFHYTEHEFETMMMDVQLFNENGADGFVFGILTDENEIDVKRCKKIVDKIRPGKDIVFHKAFDYVPDKEKAIESLIELGFTRVMTSGGEGPTMDYISVLKNLVDKYGDQIQIMPGGGVNDDNIDLIKKELNIEIVHLSAEHSKFDLMKYLATDPEYLAKFVKKAKIPL